MKQAQMVNVDISITRKIGIFEAMLTISDITNNFSVQPVVQREFVAN